MYSIIGSGATTPILCDTLFVELSKDRVSVSIKTLPLRVMLWKLQQISCSKTQELEMDIEIWQVLIRLGQMFVVCDPSRWLLFLTVCASSELPCTTMTITKHDIRILHSILALRVAMTPNIRVLKPASALGIQDAYPQGRTAKQLLRYSRANIKPHFA